MDNEPDHHDTLRTAAETELARARKPEVKPRPAEELLRELQVHQIELELQNEQLRQSQVELEKSRDRYVDFYDFAPAGYLTLNHDGMIGAINLPGAALFGMVRNKLLGRRFASFVAPEDIDRWYRHFLSLLKNDNKLSCELALRIGDGSRFYAQLDCLRLKKDGNEPVVRIVLTDITRRKQTEEELQKFFNLIPDLACIASTNGYFLKINPMWQETLGYTEQEILATPYLDLIHPDDRDATAKEIERQLAGKPTVQFINRYRCRDGSYKWLEWRATPAASKEMLFASARDITERMQAEKKLRDSESRYRSLFENMLNGFAYCRMLYDQDGQPVDFVYLDVNESFGRLTGLKNVVGKPVSEVIPGIRKLSPELFEIYGRVAATGVPVAFEFDFKAQDKWLAISVYSPEQGYFVAIFDDITERKRTEQFRLDMDQRKDEFLAMLAHELRNPLAPIRNAAHVLGRLELTEPKVLWAQQIIEEQVTHLSRMVDDLMDASRIARNKIMLKKETIELATLLEQVIESARPLAAHKGQQLALHLPVQAVQLEGDPVRLSQVLFNLIDNAIKYTPDHGQIELAARLDGEEIEMVVRDNGMGITAELLPHVFDLFQQGERALDRAQGGLGIGLTLVQRLVGMHGGRVKAYSEGPELGSTFTVRLPARAAPAQPAALEAGDKNCPIAGMRVLVVDDDYHVAGSTAVVLELDGYEVRVAATGQTALEMVPDFRPQVVLLDIGLKGMDGFETAQRLRELPEGRDLCLVAVTGYGDEKTRARAMASGCDHFLVKPVTYKTLSSLLRKASS